MAYVGGLAAKASGALGDLFKTLKVDDSWGEGDDSWEKEEQSWAKAEFWTADHFKVCIFKLDF